jgi:hypothetical protein
VDGPLIRLLAVQRAIHPIRRAPLTGPPPQPPWVGQLKPEGICHFLAPGAVLACDMPEEDIPMTSETTATTGIASPQQNAAVPAPGRRLGLALAVISMAQLMLVLDELIVNTALPHIQRALHFSGTSLEWVIT